MDYLPSQLHNCIKIPSTNKLHGSIIIISSKSRWLFALSPREQSFFAAWRRFREAKSL